MNYHSFTELDALDGIRHPALGVPPGVAVESQIADMLRDVAKDLGLPEFGVVTPWATRSGDMVWQEIDNPDTNIASFGLTDAKITEATQALFGQPLPFVSVMTPELQMSSELERILEGSDYEFFETQGVYRQDDDDPIPNILFLHWLRIRDLPNRPTRNVKPMERVASDMRGSLMFSQQVPVQGTTLRERPLVSFEDAFELQEPAPIDIIPGPPGAPRVPPPVISPGQPQPPAVEPPAPLPPPTEQGPAKQSMVGPILVGFGLLAATVLVGKAVRKK